MGVLLLSLLVASPAFSADHELKASAKTVVVGYYDPATPPALRIRSGDRVRVHTLGVAGPTILQSLGASPIQPELLEVAAANPNQRGHFLTGPIFVESADPGDVLEVRIEAVELALPYAYNGMGSNGVLADLFPKGGRKLIPLDAKRRRGLLAHGVEVPLRPFFGSMGVAPAAGRVSSTPPGSHAGNLDNKELVAGTTLFIPVHVAGALFQVGDGHAAQGDGEADQTGLETSLTGRFQFIVRKDMKLKWPRAETPAHVIAMGLDEDLNKAVRLATEEAMDYLTRERRLSREDAYMLISVGVDLRITQLVDRTKGVHAMIPKALFVNSPRR